MQDQVSDVSCLFPLERYYNFLYYQMRLQLFYF